MFGRKTMSLLVVMMMMLDSAMVIVSGGMAVIQNQLQETLEKNSLANIIVTMKGGVDRAIERSSRHVSISRAEKISFLADSLMEQATESQAQVMELLSSQRHSNEYQSFWASNTVFVSDASYELVLQLAALEDVEEIHEEHIVTLDSIIEDDSSFNGTTANGMQWGVEKISAPSVWDTGINGSGIIVGAIDTGVRVSHEILSSNWIGNSKNGWYDPYTNSKTPIDAHGHGTHTMGTIVGQNGYGVAPGAKWLACRGCNQRTCTEKALLDCGQYTLCPTDYQGKNKNCEYAPHVSSNSWGGGANQKWYYTTVQSWRAADIIPVFAQGNSGPRCSTANSPGDYDIVIGVGASTSSDSLASFSSVGPTRGTPALMKPDVSAPGSYVSSAWMDSDSGYKTISGTSMACPHVAGSIALMLATNPELDYDDIYEALTSSCSQKLQDMGKTCGVKSDIPFPNNLYGFGVVHSKDACGYYL